MSAASDYLESGILSHIFRGITFSTPLTLAIALASGSLDDAMGGNLGNMEIANAGGYARQIVAPSTANWSFVANASAGSGMVENINAITFPTATANWGSVTNVAITDSGVYGLGRLLFHGPLTVAKTVTTNDTFSFGAGNLEVYLS